MNDSRSIGHLAACIPSPSRSTDHRAGTPCALSEDAVMPEIVESAATALVTGLIAIGFVAEAGLLCDLLGLSDQCLFDIREWSLWFMAGIPLAIASVVALVRLTARAWHPSRRVPGIGGNR